MEALRVSVMTARERVTVQVAEAGTRLHVRVTHPDYATQQDGRDSFRAAFPRHGERTWLHGDPAAKEPRGCWSIPRHAWRVLEAWAVGQGYRVTWADDTESGDVEAS